MILAIDDDPDILVIVESTLRGAGHEVIATSKPTTVASLAAENRVDAVILDIQMPDLSGYEVLRKLRDQPQTGGVPILFLSALSDSKNRIRGLREGADDFLTKPFAPEELALRIERLIGQRSSALAEAPLTEPEDLEKSLADQRVVGQVFMGRYKVLQVVGEGAMGMVFRGWDPRLKRPVALKTLRFDRHLTEQDRSQLISRLLQEAITVARFNHPNIVAVYDVAQGPNTAFIAMEYVDGNSLAEHLADEKRLSSEQVVPLAQGIASALATAHENRVVHRDVKPGNVLLGNSGAIKVTDFGVAQLVTALSASEEKIFGTPGYLPPEALLNSTYDKTGDLFGLGVILYQCLTGERPFGGDTVHKRMISTVNDQVMPPRALAPKLSTELNQLVLDLLEKEPTKRVGSATEVLERLATMEHSAREPRWKPARGSESSE